MQAVAPWTCVDWWPMREPAYHFSAHRESTRKPAVQAPPPQRSSEAKSQRGHIDPAENWASVQSAFREGIGSACTHEAGTARTGFKKAAAKFIHNKRSHVLAASKVVTYLDEACEKRRGIYGRPLSSGAAPSSSIVKSRMLASGIINLRQGADRVLHHSANGATRQVALRWCCAHAARA